MAGWDGRMVRDRPEPLIATAWLYATARRVLADEMGDERFRNWWHWQVDILNDAMMDDRWCDDRETPTAESCRDAVRAGFADALEALRGRYGEQWLTWSWGGAHELRFRHQVFANLPYIGDHLVPTVPTPGDYFTINRGGMRVTMDGARFPHVHGPGMRMAVDMSHPDAPVFNLAGGQSGHPLSSHYSDLLPEWAEGTYRTFQNPAEDVLILRPQQKKSATAEETKP
jgi:penicillin amidase